MVIFGVKSLSSFLVLTFEVSAALLLHSSLHFLLMDGLGIARSWGSECCLIVKLSCCIEDVPATFLRLAATS